MSDNRVNVEKPFDIFAFDAAGLDIDSLLEGLSAYREDTTYSMQDWEISEVHSSSIRNIYYLEPQDRERFPALSAKIYHDGNAASAQREYQVLNALYDFGVIIAPRPFYLSDSAAYLGCPVLITEWVRGEPLHQAPSPDNEDMWHRIMAMLGIPNNLPFGKYASGIPMMGTGPQSPKDVIDIISRQLSQLDQNHPDFATLTAVLEEAQRQITDEWNSPPKITLNHLDPAVNHFIYDGHHLRIVGFNKADWSDTAFAVGQLCAHPDFEEVSPSHWVWYRWELARLTNDDTLTARATTYTNLLQVYWTIKLTVDAENSEINPQVKKRFITQRDRYLKRATRLFSVT